MRRAHEEHWESVTTIEEYIHGSQQMAYKVLTVSTTHRERLQINNIEEEQWVKHYKYLWYCDTTQETIIGPVDVRGLNDTEFEVTGVLASLKNSKATGTDRIMSELLKSRGMMLHL